MNSLKLLAASAALAISGSAASAVTLSITGGTSVAFGTGNYDSVCDGGLSINCYDPSGTAGGLTEDLSAYDAGTPGPGVSIDGQAYVTVTYMGKEAGATNSAFSMAGGTISTTQSVGTTYTINSGAAGFDTILDFGFSSNFLGFSQATNAGVFTNATAIAFSEVFNGGKSIYAFFDDSGASVNRDFDDMVVRIDVQSVPVPAGALLMGTALAGFGFARRKKK